MAFAIGRAIGSSVVRNRVRRLLRAVLTSVPTSVTGVHLPPGYYLIGARPAIVELSFAQLTSEVFGLVTAVHKQILRPAADSSDL